MRSEVAPTPVIPSDGAALSELREAAGSMEDVRADKIEAAKADIANGTLGTEEDYRRAVDALMMEL